MPSASVMILRCVGLLVARRLMAARPHQARWVASRRSGSRQTRISLRLPTCLGSGLNLYTFEGRTASFSTWIQAKARPMVSKSVWNGHYACTCYHPLFVFNQFGDLERCALRPGNVHSADGWDGTLKPVVARYQRKVSRIYVRADAAFAVPGVYEYLEAERIKYAIRLPANQVLQNRIGYLLKRPVGRPPNEVRRFHANF